MALCTHPLAHHPGPAPATSAQAPAAGQRRDPLAAPARPGHAHLSHPSGPVSAGQLEGCPHTATWWARPSHRSGGPLHGQAGSSVTGLSSQGSGFPMSTRAPSPRGCGHAGPAGMPACPTERCLPLQPLLPLRVPSPPPGTVTLTGYHRCHHFPEAAARKPSPSPLTLFPAHKGEHTHVPGGSPNRAGAACAS